MGRKRQQNNEFYFFMMEKKPELEKRLGRIVTMAELPSLVVDEWKALPEIRKQKYRNMRDRNRGTTEKLDCRGLPLKEIALREEERRKKVEDMKQEIVNTVDMYYSSNALHRATFYIISTSYYVRTEEDCFSPAELGLVQFNFERGIIKEHHVIVKPVIPAGYTYLSQMHSEATHKLLEENNSGIDDKEEVSQGLKEFVIEEGNRLPPIYTLEDEMAHTEAIINDIAGREYFRIYSLDKLFQHLYSTTFPEHPIPQSIAKDMLNHCGLDYHPAIACEWHTNYQKDAVKYCSLSCARRWVFMMCDNMNLVETFGIEPCEDKHLPRASPSCGVLVDVPRNTVQEYHGPRNKSTDKLPGIRTDSDDDDDSGFSFAYSRRKGKPVTSPSRDTSQSSWSGVVAGATGTSSSRTFSTRFSQKFDGSLEHFPALGAGVAHKGTDRNFSSTQLDTFGGVGSGFKPDDDPRLGFSGAGCGRNLPWPKPKK